MHKVVIVKIVRNSRSNFKSMIEEKKRKYGKYCHISALSQ